MDLALIFLPRPRLVLMWTLRRVEAVTARTDSDSAAMVAKLRSLDFVFEDFAIVY